MSRKLVVQGTIYNYPDPGEDLGTWGDEASSWAEAVTDTLSLLVGATDILPTSFLIANNNVSPVAVRGLYFNPAMVRAANVSYSIYRETDINSVVETGELLISYDNNAPIGQKFKVTQRINGNSGVLLTVDDSGQFFYSSSNLLGVNYVGIMKFSARTLSI